MRRIWAAGAGACDGWVYVSSAEIVFGAPSPFDYASTGVICQGPLPPTWTTPASPSK